MELNENLAATIRAYMRRKRMSLTDFADELGISRGSLYDYINARGNPSFATVEQISRSLGISPTALLAGVTGPDRREIVLLLLDTLQGVSELPEEDRVQMAELFLRMVKLWSKE